MTYKQGVSTDKMAHLRQGSAFGIFFVSQSGKILFLDSNNLK